MKESVTKAQRLLQIEALLLAHPEGLTQSEIARRMNVNRSTIFRYLPDLTEHAPIFEEDGRLYINRESFLVNLRLNLHEALSLHLAVRLLTNHMERHNPHAASLLRQLSHSIETLSPQISHHMKLSADVIDDPGRFKDPHYIATLEVLALAWAEGRKVKVWHRHTKTEQVFEYLFSPYFVEPYAVGHSIHAIGLREPPGNLRTFNLARIERIEFTKNYYQIPSDFDPLNILRSAWGIWYTHGAPQEVILEFSPRVAPRVLETKWHVTQQIQKNEDGSLIWKASVAEPKEMIPWIRGWGADCKVHSPISLRFKIINEISQMQANYIKHQGEQHFQFWAKFAKDDEKNYHPLIWHMLDSAAVAKTLWEDLLSTAFKQSLSDKFKFPIDELGKLLAFWISLHDIGKASPEFQKKNTFLKNILEANGFDFPKLNTKVEGFHGTGTALILRRIFPHEMPGAPPKFLFDLASTLGGHHGEFPSDNLLTKYDSEKFHMGGSAWQAIQDTIFFELARFFDVKYPETYPTANKDLKPFFLLLAGLTTTADWIASSEDYFPYLNADLPLEEYFRNAVNQAKNALTAMGWYGWKPSKTPVTFEELFPEFMPNTIQRSVIERSAGLDSPFLAIIEAPTGSGKTEAAFYLADTALQRDGLSGIYVAMPTQATSNQMFGRTAKFLAHRYAENELNLHLVHGAALMKTVEERLRPLNIWGEDEPEKANIHSHTWFFPRKRTLLAPFGVGTVDQTFLSVLQTRHFFLRLFGLSHKVLIFDEVHAYDVYMNEIFKTLLTWLHAVGTSVIILSATLPPQTRIDLMKAYGAQEISDVEVEFPRLSIVDGTKALTLNAGSVSSREVTIKWLDQDAKSIVNTLKEQLSEGGCAAVICNRVKRAQEVYEAVSQGFYGEDVDITLFHAAFPYSWRAEIEEKVINQFKKDSKLRPKRSIVIATQVIEQSLDLDFDFLITDLAPIDLLIQRMGRLQRHHVLVRPQQLKQPVCVICAPNEIGDDDLVFGKDRVIYSSYLLYRTWLELKKHASLRLPEQTDMLIQSVYTSERSQDITDMAWERLEKFKLELVRKQEESKANARNYLIPLPNKVQLGSFQTSLSDDPEARSKRILIAPTREISPIVNLVCLVKVGELIRTISDPSAIDINQPLTYQQVNACLRSSVTISDWSVIDYFLSNPSLRPQSFREKTALRYHFPAVFEEHLFETEKFTIYLDKNKGVQVIRE